MSSPSQLADFYRKDQIFQMEDRLNQLNSRVNPNNTASASSPPPQNANISTTFSTGNDTSLNMTNNNISTFSGASPLPRPQNQNNNNNNDQQQQPVTPSGAETSQLYLGRRSPTLDPRQPPSFESVPPANPSKILTRKEAAAARLRSSSQNSQLQQQQSSSETPAPVTSPKPVSSYAEYEKEVSKMGGQILPSSSPSQQQQQTKHSSASPSHLERAIQERTEAEKIREAELAKQKEAAELRKKIRETERLIKKKQADAESQQQQQNQPQNQSHGDINQQQQQQRRTSTSSASASSPFPARTSIDQSATRNTNMMRIPEALKLTDLPDNAEIHIARNRAQELCRNAESPMVRRSNVAVSGDVDFRGQGGAFSAANTPQNPSSPQSQQQQPNDLTSVPSLGNYSTTGGGGDGDGSLEKEPSMAVDFSHPHGVGAMPNVPSSVPPPTREVVELLSAQAKPNPVLIPQEIDAHDIQRDVEQRQSQRTPREVAASVVQQNKRVDAPFPTQADFDIMAGKTSPTKNNNNSNIQQQQQYPHQDYYQGMNASTTNNNNIPPNSTESGTNSYITSPASARPAPAGMPKLPIENLPSYYYQHQAVETPAEQIKNDQQQQQQQQLAENSKQSKDALSKYMEHALGYGSEPPTPRSATSSAAPPIQIMSTAFNTNNSNFNDTQQQHYSSANKPTAEDEAFIQQAKAAAARNRNLGADANSSVNATQGNPSPQVGVSQVPSGKNSVTSQQGYYHSSGAFAFGKVPHPGSSSAAEAMNNTQRTGSDFMKQQEQQKNHLLAQRVQALKHQLDPLGAPQPVSSATEQQQGEMPPDGDENDARALGVAFSSGSPQIKRPTNNNNNNSNDQSGNLANTMALVAMQQDENNKKTNESRQSSVSQQQSVEPLGLNRNTTQNPIQVSNNNNNSNTTDDHEGMGEQQQESHHFGLQQQQQLNSVVEDSMMRQYGEQSSPARLIRRLHESERQRLALVREVEALKTDLKEAIETQTRMNSGGGSATANAAAQALMRNSEKAQNKLNASHFDPNQMNENVIVRVRSTDAAEGDGAQWAAEIDEEEQAKTRAQQVITEMLRAIDARKAAEARLKAVHGENERLRQQQRDAQQREAKLHQMLTQYQEAFQSWRSTWNADQQQGDSPSSGLVGSNNEVVLGKSSGLSSVRVQILESRVEALTNENEKLRSEINVQAAKRKAQDEAEAARSALRGGSSSAGLGITSTSSAATMRRRGTDQETDVLVRMFELQRNNEHLQREMNDMKLQQRRY